MSLSFFIMTQSVLSCCDWLVLGGYGGYGGGTGVGYHLGAGQKAAKRGTEKHETWKWNYTGCQHQQLCLLHSLVTVFT